MDATPLSAQSRTEFGKGAARKIRAAGRIPALVYRDGVEPAHISVDPAELRLIFQRSSNPNTILAIDTGAGVKNCVLTATQKNPVSRRLLHADFFEVREDQKLLVEVPVAHVGKAKGIVVGGKMQNLRHTLPIRALPQNIPAVIEIDVSEMDLGDMMRASAVVPPEGCEVVTTIDFNIFACKGRRTDAAADEAEAAAAAAE
jgi:large subunit ribosomal protein L25